MNPLSAAGRTIYVVFDAVLSIIYWLVLIWVVLSWVMLFASQTSFRWKYRGAYNVLATINDFFTRATHPLLKPFRKILPPWKTGGSTGPPSAPARDIRDPLFPRSGLRSGVSVGQSTVFSHRSSVLSRQSSELID